MNTFISEGVGFLNFDVFTLGPSAIIKCVSINVSCFLYHTLWYDYSLVLKMKPKHSAPQKKKKKKKKQL